MAPERRLCATSTSRWRDNSYTAAAVLTGHWLDTVPYEHASHSDLGNVLPILLWTTAQRRGEHAHNVNLHAMRCGLDFNHQFEALGYKVTLEPAV